MAHPKSPTPATVTSEARLHLRNKHKVFSIFAILAAIGIIIFLSTADWQLIADERKASTFSASKEITSLADFLSLTRKGKAVFFASQPKLLGSTEFNKTCGRDGKSTFTAGCYYKDSKGDEHGIICQNWLRVYRDFIPKKQHFIF